MTQQRAAMQMALEALENNRQTHYYCEDNWYSCPKHEDGCANEAEGDKCNCGADKANIEIDAAITALREALAQPQGEWVDLTASEIWDIREPQYLSFANALIAKFKEKNTPPSVEANDYVLCEVQQEWYVKGWKDAVEKAAKVCEGIANDYAKCDEVNDERTAKECAAAIREMK